MKKVSSAHFLFPKKIFLAAALALAGTLSVFAKTISYSGSDFLRGDPEKSLNAAIEKTFGEQAQSTLRGSVAGEAELRAGKADFAMLIVLGKIENVPEVRDKTWRAFPLAYQVSYIAVSAANPAEAVTFEQLAAIFGKFSKKNATSWTEAGLPEFSSAMRPCIGDIAKTDAVTFFQDRALPNFALKNSVRGLQTDAAVFKEIVNDPGVIAVVGSPVPAGVPAKMLAVANDRGKPGNATPYPPTFTNIYNADYPLTIPLYVVYPAAKRELLKPVLRHLYSDEMAEKLTAAGFVALDANLRNVFQKGIDNIK